MSAGIWRSMIFWKMLSGIMAESSSGRGSRARIYGGAIGSNRRDADLPWVIGIDEAGYGPNLGPLVMSAVACLVPAGQEGHDLWELLRAGVRRHGEKDDGRAVVADSKLVFSQARGLADLEHGVLATGCFEHLPADLSGFVNWACADSEAELRRECWYRGDSPTPAAAEIDHCRR